ncbi:MAG: M48 family metalloprotease [Gammaproteobacteria bacterium]
MSIVHRSTGSFALRKPLTVLAILSLVGCAGAPVKPFEMTADTSHLNHAQRVVWQESDEQDTAFKNMGVIYNDAALQTYLQSVIYRLYPQFRGTIKIHALMSPVPDAFMMANGSCYVQLGLLALLDNEAELATVLGHEGGHFVLQHAVQEHEYAENTSALGMALGITLIGPFLAVSSIYGYSREMEAQADTLGFQRLQTAGYAVNQSTMAFKRLDAYSNALAIKEPYFFADHPKLQERIRYFSSQAALIKQTGGYVGAKEYLAATQKARMWVLQEDLSRQDYKSLIFFLEDPWRLAKYLPQARYYLGRAYLLRGGTNDQKNAEVQLRQCIQQIPDFAPPYEALGKLMMQQHKNAYALKLFQQYLQLSPDAPDAGYVQLYIKRLIPSHIAKDTP